MTKTAKTPVRNSKKKTSAQKAPVAAKKAPAKKPAPAKAAPEKTEKVQTPEMPQATPPAAGKVSALDAASQVLATAGGPLNVKQLIEAMAAQGLWTSPGGKTPAATLSAAIQREIKVKGDAARFRKAERGLFSLNG